jgi:hypothetical protein
VWTDVSEERAASIFRLEKSASEEPAWASGCRLSLVPRSRICLLWGWRRYVPPKRRFTQDLHGATSQKTAFFPYMLIYRLTTICREMYDFLNCTIIHRNQKIWSINVRKICVWAELTAFYELEYVSVTYVKVGNKRLSACWMSDTRSKHSQKCWRKNTNYAKT